MLKSQHQPSSFWVPNALRYFLVACISCVMFSCSSVPEPTTKQTKLLAFAKQFVGTPYCKAGETTSCFDCSGYVNHCFASAGVKLPRSSQDIANSGTTISISNIQLADVILFGSSTTAISHVGIYAGNNTFYHASTTKGVMLSSMNDKYWKPKVQGARRYM